MGSNMLFHALKFAGSLGAVKNLGRYLKNLANVNAMETMLDHYFCIYST